MSSESSTVPESRRTADATPHAASLIQSLRDIGYPWKEHQARAASEASCSWGRSAISASWSEPSGKTRSGLQEVSCRDLCPRMLLAPSRELPLLDDPRDTPGILGSKIRRQCRTGLKKSVQIADFGVACCNSVGMRVEGSAHQRGRKRFAGLVAKRGNQHA